MAQTRAKPKLMDGVSDVSDRNVQVVSQITFTRLTLRHYCQRCQNVRITSGIQVKKKAAHRKKKRSVRFSFFVPICPCVPTPQFGVEPFFDALTFGFFGLPFAFPFPLFFGCRQQVSDGAPGQGLRLRKLDSLLQSSLEFKGKVRIACGQP